MEPEPGASMGLSCPQAMWGKSELPQRPWSMGYCEPATGGQRLWAPGDRALLIPAPAPRPVPPSHCACALGENVLDSCGAPKLRSRDPLHSDSEARSVLGLAGS